MRRLIDRVHRWAQTRHHQAQIALYHSLLAPPWPDGRGTVHQAPQTADLPTACCDLPLCDLPRFSRISHNPAHVTCEATRHDGPG
jgi:hypothetical protein